MACQLSGFRCMFYYRFRCMFYHRLSVCWLCLQLITDEEGGSGQPGSSSTLYLTQQHMQTYTSWQIHASIHLLSSFHVVMWLSDQLESRLDSVIRKQKLETALHGLGTFPSCHFLEVNESISQSMSWIHDTVRVEDWLLGVHTAMTLCYKVYYFTKAGL